MVRTTAICLGFDSLAASCDIVQVARSCKLPVEIVGNLYFEVGAKLHLSWMRQVIRRISPHSYWQRISAKTLVDDIYDQQKRLTSEVIKYFPSTFVTVLSFLSY